MPEDPNEFSRKKMDKEFDFSEVPEAMPEKSELLSKYSDEFKDYQALLDILYGEGLDHDSIRGIVEALPEEPTIDDMATINARLMEYAASQGIDRRWLIRQMTHPFSKRRRLGGIMSGWLKNAAPMEDTELEIKLPTKGQPNLGKEPPMAPKEPAKAPKEPMKGPEAGGLGEVKRMLDSGDLKGALSALKKLVGDEKPHEEKKAPFLGKPKDEKSEEKKPEAPKKDEAPEAPKPAFAEKKASAQGVEFECGNCGRVLELPPELKESLKA